MIARPPRCCWSAVEPGGHSRVLVGTPAAAGGSLVVVGGSLVVAAGHTGNSQGAQAVVGTPLQSQNLGREGEIE